MKCVTTCSLVASFNLFFFVSDCMRFTKLEFVTSLHYYPCLIKELYILFISFNTSGISVLSVGCVTCLPPCLFQTTHMPWICSWSWKSERSEWGENSLWTISWIWRRWVLSPTSTAVTADAMGKFFLMTMLWSKINDFYLSGGACNHFPTLTNHWHIGSCVHDVDLVDIVHSEIVGSFAVGTSEEHMGIVDLGMFQVEQWIGPSDDMRINACCVLIIGGSAHCSSRLLLAWYLHCVEDYRIGRSQTQWLIWPQVCSWCLVCHWCPCCAEPSKVKTSIHHCWSPQWGHIRLHMSPIGGSGSR